MQFCIATTVDLQVIRIKRFQCLQNIISIYVSKWKHSLSVCVCVWVYTAEKNTDNLNSTNAFIFILINTHINDVGNDVHESTHIRSLFYNYNHITTKRPSLHTFPTIIDCQCCCCCWLAVDEAQPALLSNENTLSNSTQSRAHTYHIHWHVWMYVWV